jgi:hypothetical protein
MIGEIRSSGSTRRVRGTNRRLFEQARDERHPAAAGGYNKHRIIQTRVGPATGALKTKGQGSRAMHLSKLLPSSRLLHTTGLACAAAVASAAALTATASPAAPARASAAPRCAASGLVVWLNTTGNGAAGSVYYNLYLTNLTRRPCTLRGYPRVSAVDLAGHQVGAPASRETDKKPAVVTLGRGVTATAVLRIVAAGNFPAAGCGAVTAAGLRVFPPGQRASKVVPFPFQACSRAGQSVLSVRTVVPRA